MEHAEYVGEAVGLLRRVVAVPSASGEEGAVADLLSRAVSAYGFEVHRSGNNLWALSPGFDVSRPTLLLNAHLDTVRPVPSWTRDPYSPGNDPGVVWGLGSNDCGGGLVSLLQAFRLLCARGQAYNVVYLASAEEEISGAGGISSVLPQLPRVDLAMVGEPTGMRPAIAERGLMVIDAVARGRSGHVAGDSAVNAIYVAMDDIAWIRGHRIGPASDLLGETRAAVTIVSAGTQHNVVPDECRFTIDVRTNELCSNEEAFGILSGNLESELRARSFRLRSSRIGRDAPVVRRCLGMGMEPYGSPTLSDQALMPFASLKLGPGDPARSHTADEFIMVGEIADAIGTYAALLDGLDLGA